MRETERMVGVASLWINVPANGNNTLQGSCTHGTQLHQHALSVQEAVRPDADAIRYSHKLTQLGSHFT